MREAFRVALFASVLPVQFALPVVCGADLPPAVINKLAEQQRKGIVALRAQIDDLESALKDYKTTDYSKEISKLEAAVTKLEAVIVRRKKEGRGVASNQRQLDVAKAQLDALKEKQSTQRGTYHTMTKQLANAKDRLADAKSLGMAREPLFRLNGRDFQALAKGDVGAIYGEYTRVLQILDERSMLISVSIPRTGASAVALLKMPTEGLADGTPLQSANGRLFAVTGTHQYVAVSGAKSTVIAIEEVDAGALANAVAKINGDAP